MNSKSTRIVVAISAAALALMGLLLAVSSTGAASPSPLIPDDQGGVTVPGFKPASAVPQPPPSRGGKDAEDWLPGALHPTRGVRAGIDESLVPARLPLGCPLPTYQSKAGIESATVSVSITESGLDPTIVTITVGSTVVWTNYLEETVHLARLYRVYLPLVLSGVEGLVARNGSAGLTARASSTTAATASPLVADAAATRQGYEWGNVNIAPGQSYTHTFTLADEYLYSLRGPVDAEGCINVEPLQTDEPVLMWATGEQGVLLRWRWPSKDAQSGRPLEQPIGYYVYRDGNLLNSQPITYVTVPTEAIAILGSHWDWIQATYTNVTTIAELHAFLDSNRLAEQWLADQRYPVALVRGLGYLDGTVTPGAYTHTYRVEAMLLSGSEDVGTVAIKNNGVTPLEPPSTITVTVVVSDDLRVSPDWVLAQQNRKAHGQVFLLWNLPEESPSRQLPEKWTTSYDIFRAGPVGPGDDPATMRYTRITTEPVVPMADHDPVTLTLAGGDPYTVPYEHHEYYYADASETLTVCQTYAYRVAPRDLLGQVADSSDYVTAPVPDTMPPDPPVVLTPTVDHGGGTITITWQPVTDAVQYRVYRSEVLTAGWPGLTNCSVYSCWITMTTTSLTSWVDSSAVYEQRYWYVVRAEDAPCTGDPPNMSAPSNAVTAILHDRIPPGAPTNVYTREQVIYWTPHPDTEYSLLYCSFDDDPRDGEEPEKMLIAEVPSTTVHFDPATYYTAPVPVDTKCWLQPVDANGNRGALTPLLTIPLICRANAAYTLTAPAIVSITTRYGGVYSWTALIQWDIEEDLPRLDDFRVYRQEGNGPREDLTAAGPLGWDVRQFEDDEVKPGFLYTYTVAAVLAPGCGDEFPRYVHSGARLYKVVPPLDCCTRPVGNLGWVDHTFTPGTGTRLAWTPPYMGYDGPMTVVVYRSLQQKGDYVAITPPFDTTSYDYTDADAEHGNYWYVVTMLDWATGEIMYKTTPRSASGGLPLAARAAVTAGAAQISGFDSWSSPPGGSLSEARRDDGGQDAHPTAPAAPADQSQIAPSADTYIASEAPTQTHGSAARMLVGYGSEVLVTDYSLVQFDLSSIPNGATIDWADFSAHLVASEGEVAHIRLLRVTDPWDEDTATWNNQPSVDVAAYVTMPVGTATGWYTWGVTSLVQQWVYTPTTYPNHGFMLQGPNEDHSRSFSTKEGDNPPRLMVYYFPPPDTLIFGVYQGDNLFEVTGATYDAGSTPGCLSGSGSVALGGSPLPTYNRSVTFSCIQAGWWDGIVTSGTATVTLPSPIAIDYPGGHVYTVTSLYLNQETGWGQVGLALPDNIVHHYFGIPWHAPVNLTPATLHQDLTFDMVVNWWNEPPFGGQDCSMAPPHFYFEMNPLPLRIVPTGPVTFTHHLVDVGQSCTQYDERYTPPPPRPGYPDPDANDGYLRPVYTSTRDAHINSNGLAGEFYTSEPVSYTTVMPYGFEIQASGGISFEIHAGRISDGMMFGISLDLNYYDKPVAKTLTTTGVLVPPPTRWFEGSADHLLIGPDGAVFGAIDAGLNPPWPVVWADGGFELRERYYFLYIPPIQTGPNHEPWEEAAADWSGNENIQAGLNLVALPPEGVAFTWYHCKGQCGASATAINFPEGVSTDLYLRRGGVSDWLEATITPGNGVPVTLYGYEHTLNSFRLSFCDNYIFDSEVEADVYLPFPADVTIPLVDMQINPNDPCMEGGRVRGDADPLTPVYWDVDLHARAVEYRPPGKCNRYLWILGTMDIPHLAPPNEQTVAPIPLEISFKPDGTFYATKLVYNKANYKFDGFSFLLSGVRLSDYDVLEQPNWAPAATLATAPNSTVWQNNGFIELQGNTVVPVFSTLKEKGGSSPPKLFVLGWDDYVGFSKQPEAERTWTALTDITWGFDLVYARHHVTSTPRGVFVGFGSDDFKVVEMDRALVLNSWIEPAKVHADILLGLSAGTGALRALAETRGLTPTNLSASLVTTMTNWASTKFTGMDTDYVTLLQKFWSRYGSQTYAKTTEVIDDWADEKGDDFTPSIPSSGGTTPTLDDWGIKLKRMRGTVAWTQDTSTGDSHFEELRISLWLDVKRSGDNEPLVHADRLTFYITRDGVYVLQGKGVKSKLYENKLEKADFIVAIKPKGPSFEASVTLYKLKVEGIVAEKAAATLGVGHNLFYLGALVHDAHPEYDLGGSIKLGGALLFGLIDPNSQVLKNGSFSTILADIGATGATAANGGLDSGGRLAGGYVRVYGEMPLYDIGCLFRIKVGGEVAAWYFASVNFTGGGCDLYGGRLRGYIYGKLLCVVSARGDLTLQIYRKSSGGQCAANPSMKGQFWAAGGIGFCDPEDWDTWEHRWWGDSWCWTAGAMVEANYNDKKPNGWWWNYDADYE